MEMLCLEEYGLAACEITRQGLYRRHQPLTPSTPDTGLFPIVFPATSECSHGELRSKLLPVNETPTEAAP